VAADGYVLKPIGVVRSPLRDRVDAPRQGSEGAPDAWIFLEPSVADALQGIAAGDQLVVVTWLHEAQRDVLQVIRATTRAVDLKPYLRERGA
jgi:tRNA (Thr-GGU) A37 N-methylase